MTLAVAIDAALIAVPSLAVDVNEAESIIGRIIYWSKIVRAEGPVRYLQLSDVAETLAKANCFPSGPNIRALLELFELDHVYSSEDIRRSVNLLLEKTEAFSDVLGIEVIEFSNNFELPDLKRLYADEYLYESVVRLLLSSACATLVNASNVTFLVCGLAQAPRIIKYQSQIDDCVATMAVEGFCWPISVFNTSIKLVSSVDDLALTVGSLSLWNMAASAAMIHLAVATRALEISMGSGTGATLATIPSFAIGSEFLTSAFACNGGPDGTHTEVIIDACARLIIGKPKNRVRSFGTKMRQRDGASAFRLHVTKRHEALRLMFWKTPGNVIEIANIGVKSEEIIENGDPDKTTLILYQ
jgi:hypothetical protein